VRGTDQAVASRLILDGFNSFDSLPMDQFCGIGQSSLSMLGDGGEGAFRLLLGGIEEVVNQVRGLQDTDNEEEPGGEEPDDSLEPMTRLEARDLGHDGRSIPDPVVEGQQMPDHAHPRPGDLEETAIGILSAYSRCGRASNGPAVARA